MPKSQRIIKIFMVSFLLVTLICTYESLSGEKEGQSLHSLLPEIDTWNFSENPHDYFPETLYEYINGAAEIYLGYDFQRLIVSQYQMTDSKHSLLVEIYDMGNDRNSFGIYSAERYPDTHFIPAGNQGYLEEGTLNFIVGQYYIKLLCFDCEDESETFLTRFSQEIQKNVAEKGQLPPLLNVFPQEGLIPNSEKFILYNFLGYEFLQKGYLANYRKEGLEFDCFIVEGDSVEKAKDMLERFLTAKERGEVEKISSGFHVKDRYYHHIYLARAENYLCGVMKIRDGSEEVGKKYLRTLLDSLTGETIN